MVKRSFERMVMHHIASCFCTALFQILSHPFQFIRASMVTQTVKICLQEPLVWLLGWKIPWKRTWQPTPVFLTGKFLDTGAGGLQSVGSQRVGHDWASNTHSRFIYWVHHWKCTYISICFTAGNSSAKNKTSNPKGRMSPRGMARSAGVRGGFSWTRYPLDILAQQPSQEWTPEFS